MKRNMRPARAACGLLILLLLAAACSNLSAPYRIVSQMNLPATPEFVLQIIVVGNGEDSESMCIEISQEPFVELGNRADDLSDHLYHNTRILIDGESLSQDSVHIFQYMTAALAFNDLRTPIGSYGGDMSFCFSLGHLAPGIHAISIDAHTMSGVSFTYSWSFETVASSEAGRSGIRATLTPLPTITPTP